MPPMTRFAVDPTIGATPAAEIAEALKAPAFGRYFGDHLALAAWNREQGWHDRRIVAHSDRPMNPGLAALQYGQSIFEGMKAFRHQDGSVWLFRPEMNAARFARSAARMAMPALPEEDFLDAVYQLVDLDRAWVPEGVGEQSLYIRPFMIGSETLIGVREAYEYEFMVLTTPVGPYYNAPMTLWVTPNYSRSAVGGTGTAKCAGNYGAAMVGEAEAHEHGCGQVLWLDSATRRFVEEAGTMNFLMVTADDELVTPSLDSKTILAGITRDSLLQLAGEHGLTPVERPIELAEVKAGLDSGRITELLCCGTAAVVSPVVGLKTPEWEATVGDGEPGPRTQALRKHLTDIQFGRAEDTRGWLREVPSA